MIIESHLIFKIFFNFDSSREKILPNQRKKQLSNDQYLSKRALENMNKRVSPSEQNSCRNYTIFSVPICIRIGQTILHVTQAIINAE